MAFNLNTSRKPEVQLYKNLTRELISTFGVPCLYLFSEKVNKDFTFKDFTHFRVDPDKATQIYVMPENPENWEDTETFNQFGFFNNGTQHVFITKDVILELYPDIDESKETWRTEFLNSLLLLPSNTLLEITDIQQYHEGINNLWAFQDQITSYKLAVKVYDTMMGDEGITDIKDTVTLEEQDIFEKEELVSPEDIDDFFAKIDDNRDERDHKAKLDPPAANNDNVFGNLG
jgi:hypothetical protein